MNVLDAVRRRRSIRHFENTPVEKEKLDKVLEAARLSPSAANCQPWRFIVITNNEVKKKMKLAFGADWLTQAPVIIVACAVPKESWYRLDGESYWKVDVAIALQSLILTATELGLGTCWIANFNEELAKKAIGIPNDWRVVALSPLGYARKEKGLVEDRKPIREIVQFRN